MKRSKSLNWVLVLTLVLSLLISGCSTSSSSTSKSAAATGTTSTATNDVIKIGVFQPITGAMAGLGSYEVEGYEFANSLRSEVLGKKVELSIVDNKSDKVEAANAVTRLIEKDKVCVILGSCGSSLSIAGGAVAAKAGIPCIASTATNPQVTQGNDWYFRICFMDTFQGQVMAKYAYDSLKCKKVGIVRELSNDFCVGLASYFTKTFTGLTGDQNSVVVADFNTGDQDFSSQLTMLMQKKVEALFVPAPSNFGDAALIAKQMHDLGYDVPILGSDGYEVPELISLGGADLNGKCYFSTFFDTSADLTPQTANFLKLYRDKFKKDPAPSTVLCYDAYNLALDAIEAAGSTDGAAIKTALEKVNKWPGVGGYVTFDTSHNANKPAVIKTIKDGKFNYIDTVYMDSAQ